MNAERWAARALATGLGAGYWPWGPGTVGSAAAVVVALLFQWSPVAAVLAAALTLPLAIWASGVEALTSGRKDPGHIVVDEIVGQWVTLAGASTLSPAACLLGFGLFRVFDIWKPAPVRHMENLPGGLGIMADDVMAGFYGALVLALAGWLNLY